MTYQIHVEFCMMWNYAPKAARFAEQIFSHYRHDVSEMRLVPSTGGVFEVTVNGQLVFSKKETGTFPDVLEVIEQIKNLT